MKKVFIGIDVSKLKLDATILKKGTDKIEVIGYEVFANSKDGVKKLTGWVRKSTGTAKEECLCCAETTGSYDRLLCDFLYAKGHDVWRASALEMKRSSGLKRGKNDKADSKVIAEYAMRYVDKMELYSPANPKIDELRDLYLYRESLVGERTSKLVRAKEIKATSATSKAGNFMYKTSMEDAASLLKRINECNRRIKEIIDPDEELSRNYGHITSIKGVSVVNGTALLIFTENFTKFSSPNKMATYYGVAPFRNRSGTSLNSRADISRYCNRKLKGLPSQAALCAVKFNEDLRLYYNRLTASGKPAGIAINNVRNKLLHIIFSLVKNDCDYEDHHEWKRKNIGPAEFSTV